MKTSAPVLVARPVDWRVGGVIFTVSAALAALMSPSVSLWNDEAVTISATERSFAQLWELLQRIDAVHGLYYAFMSGWVDVFGASAFSLRLPSALAAGGTALGVYVLARAMATPSTALLAAGLCATLPRMTWGGIEARPFVFSALTAVWASFLFLRCAQRSRLWWWVSYVAVAGIGVFVNIYLVLLIIAHAVTAVLRTRRRRALLPRFLLAAACVAVMSAPLLLVVRSQQGQLGDGGDRNPFSIGRKVLVNQFFLGETPSADATAAWFTSAWQGAAILACALGLTAIAIAIARPPASGDDKSEILSLTLPWIIIPTAVVAAYAVAVSPIYQPRYLTFTAPAAAILIAVGLRAIGRRWFAVAGVALYALSVTVVFSSQRTPFAKSGSDWSAAAAVVGVEHDDGEAVYFAPRIGVSEDGSVQHTTRRIAQAYPADFAGLTDVTLEQSGARSGTLDGYSSTLDSALPNLADYEKVWALYSKKSPADVFSSSNALFVREGYSATQAWDGPSTRVIEYTRAR